MPDGPVWVVVAGADEPQAATVKAIASAATAVSDAAHRAAMDLRISLLSSCCQGASKSMAYASGRELRRCLETAESGRRPARRQLPAVRCDSVERAAVRRSAADCCGSSPCGPRCAAPRASRGCRAGRSRRGSGCWRCRSQRSPRSKTRRRGHKAPREAMRLGAEDNEVRPHRAMGQKRPLVVHRADPHPFRGPVFSRLTPCTP
jgi:hypothetical protein